MKKELEEAANNFADKFLDEKDEDSPFQAQAALLGFEQGVKWAQERMYSEEEVLKLLYELHLIHNMDNNMTFMKIDEWFKQFKKK